MRNIVAVLIVLLFVGCGKDDPPKSPEAANLTFPEQNSECTTGVDQSETTSEVEFRWQTAANTDTYELRVTQLGTSITITETTSGTSARVVLQKGTPYSWMVITRNTETMDAVSSSTWQFYNAGVQTSYPPFPAEILSPGSGSTVAINSDGLVELSWNGADVENDINRYEIYHGTDDPPTQLEATNLVGDSTLEVAVDPGTYYWRVVTIDSEGNSSDSGTYSYNAL